MITALRRRLFVLQADHKRIAKGAAWVAIFVLVGKLAGAAKEMAVAYRYGVRGPVDAYQLATTVVTWLPGTLISLSPIILVPMFVRLRQVGASERRLFVRELHGTVMLIGATLSVLAMLVAPAALPLLAGNLSATTRAMTWQLIVGMSPVALLTLLAGVYSARLMALEKQINTLLESVPALAVLLCVLLWSPGLDVSPLLWGTLIGTTAQTAWLARLAGRADGESTRPGLSWRSTHWRELGGATAVMAVGQFAMSLVPPLDQYSAARIGDSAIATLGYANRVVALLLGLGAMAISGAALPVMSDLVAAGQKARAHRVAAQWSMLMLVGGTIVVAVGWLAAPLGIRILFERGAFTAHDTVIVAQVFRWGLVQVPFYFSGLVLVQLMASRRRYDAISLFSVTNLPVKVVLNFVLSSRMGVAGIALATGLMYAWSAGCMGFVVLADRRRSA